MPSIKSNANAKGINMSPPVEIWFYCDDEQALVDQVFSLGFRGFLRETKTGYRFIGFGGRLYKNNDFFIFAFPVKNQNDYSDITELQLLGRYLPNGNFNEFFQGSKGLFDSVYSPSPIQRNYFNNRVYIPPQKPYGVSLNKPVVDLEKFSNLNL